MTDYLLGHISDQALELGYKHVRIDGDWMVYSLIGGTNPENPAIVADLSDRPPDFTAVSMDHRFRGTIARGWTAGKMLFVKLAIGDEYAELTDEEIGALQSRISELGASLSAEDQA